MENGQTLSLLDYFSNGMMFQQEKPLFIRGWDITETVTATLIRDKDSNVVAEATATVSNREFCISLPKQRASFDTYTLKVEGSSIIWINDVLIGELWMAAGQSNMENELRMTIDPAQKAALAINPYLRYFLIPRLPTFDTEMPYDPCDELPDGCRWVRGDDKEVALDIPAVGYGFAHTLFEKLNCGTSQVPVGIVHTAVGGTGIDTWLPRTTIEQIPAIKEKLISKQQYKDRESFNTAGEMNYCQPTVQYNKRIAPLHGVNLRGVLWYQGESNVGDCNPGTFYTDCLRELVKAWSQNFGDGEEELPFLFTHIAPFDYYLPEVCGYLAEQISDAWAENRSNRAQVAIYDLDLYYNLPSGEHPLHPTTKYPVGQRLAMAAMGVCYGEKNCMSPTYESAEIENNQILLHFENVGLGLKIKNGEKELLGFAIAGDDLVFVQADATITGPNTVIVRSPFIKQPKYVTYAFENYNMAANLFSSDDMPAVPFRTFRTEKASYFWDQTWLQCKDNRAWVMTNNHPEYYARFEDAWENAVVDDCCEFSDRYVIKSYFYQGKAQFGPNLAYDSIHSQLGNFRYLSFEFYPVMYDAVFTELSFISDEKFQIPCEQRGTANKWNSATIDLSSLYDIHGHKISNSSKCLSQVQKVYFHFTSDKSKTIYVSKIRLHN